jgi:hypothetical protein
MRGWQDHLHELGASGNTVGRACELRRLQGRRHDDDDDDAQPAIATARPIPEFAPVTRAFWPVKFLGIDRDGAIKGMTSLLSIG